MNNLGYQRPNIDDVAARLNEAVSELERSRTAQQQIELILQVAKINKEYSSMQTIASIRYSQDTTNKLHQAEKEYYDKNDPTIRLASAKFYKTLLTLSNRDQLTERFGTQLFNIAASETQSVDERILAELGEENKLVSEYEKLLASAKIPFAGEEYNLAGLTPFMESPDRATRKAAQEARSEFLSKHSNELDEIYADLVKVRHGAATKLGFKSYTELGYLRMNRSEYGPNEVAKYRGFIQNYLVPLSAKLRKAQEKRLQIDSLKFHDIPCLFLEGVPKPHGSSDWIVEQGKKMYTELSPETGHFYDLMQENEMMDLLNRKGKAGGGYCTYIPSANTPFIFSNFNGTSDDILVLTHEAGHAFQAYMSREMELLEYIFPTYEACEIHSMSMEYLTWPWMDLFFEDETEKFKFSHISESISYLPYMAAVDEFQHVIYADVEMSPAQRKIEWLKVEQKYMPWIVYEDNEFMAQGGYWQRQSHIYSSPFYYIDYALAQICAFQYWMRSEQDFKATWHSYLALCKLGGSRSFLKLLESAQLGSPFDEKVFMSVTQYASSWLERSGFMETT